MIILISSTVALAGTTTYGPHGSYTDNTDMCAACHSTHTGVTRHLIGGDLGGITFSDTTNQPYQICVFCHNPAGQSKYDAVDGVINDGNGNKWASSGGGVDNILSLEGPTSYAPATVPVTSKHNASGMTAVTIPGGNTSDAGKILLTCPSCHNPHGTTNGRQLNTSISVLAPDGVTTRVVDTSGVVATITNPLGKEKVTLSDQINTFCGACHTDYLNTTGGSTPSGTYNSTLYRHRVGMPPGGTANPTFNSTYFALPLSTQGNVTCLTCHYAHGTAASVSTSTYSGGSTLLRMDERGVCQNCHRKTPGQTQPTITSASAVSQDMSKLIVTFDSYMFTTAATDTANYGSAVTNPANYTISKTNSAGTTNLAINATVDPATGQYGILLQPNDSLGKTVVIPLQSTVASGDTINITVSNVKDLNGMVIANGSNTFSFKVP